MKDWISINDKLPAYDEEVFILYGGGMARAGYRQATSAKGEHWRLCVNSSQIDSVRYWMPIPNYPEEYLVPEPMDDTETTEKA